MTKRQTQLFAILLLVGAPLLVSLLSGYFLPGLKGMDVLSDQQPAAPAYMQSDPDPAAALPAGKAEPPASQTAQNGPQPNAGINAGVAYDPNGTAVHGVDPSVGVLEPNPVGGEAAAAAPALNPTGNDPSSVSPNS